MAKRKDVSSIAAIFASPTVTALLGIFLNGPDERFYQRELERLTGFRLNLVQRELGRLERSGLVRRSRSGNRVYYQAAADHPAFPGLRDAFVKTIGVADVLRAALGPWADQIAAAFVYGSVAGGSELAHSDIDVFMVTSADPAELTAALSGCADSLGREVNPSVYPLEELKRGVAAGSSFLAEIVRGPKLWLVGGDEALEELLRDRVGNAGS